MARPAPSDSSQDARFTVERYLALFDEGVLDRDDRVELLEPGRESDYEKAHPTGRSSWLRSRSGRCRRTG